MRDAPGPARMSRQPVLLHGLARRGSAPLTALGGYPPLVGPFRTIVADVSGPGEVIDPARAGLPHGPAGAEAIAVRLRRAGVPLEWGEPRPVGGRRELLAWCRQRGRSSLDVVRAQPDLLPELQLGSWVHAGWRVRSVRRAALATPGAGVSAALPPAAAADVAFWAGVRDAATAAEWQRLTRSYSALLYHRIAGEMKPGQERLDLLPAAFRRQMALLRRFGFHPLDAAELLSLHGHDGTVPRRSVVVTADDGFRDALDELTREADRRPQMFVPTAAVGGQAWWAGGEPVGDWEDLRRLVAAGGAIGSHGRAHAVLPDVGEAELVEEVDGSLAELRAALDGSVTPVLAYPHGRHDERVRARAREAGYAAAWTTALGRNGAGVDPWCLRRVGIKAWDSRLAFLWKVVTGESLPDPWERAQVKWWNLRHPR